MNLTSVLSVKIGADQGSYRSMTYMYVSGRCIQYYTKIQMDLCLDTELSMNKLFKIFIKLGPNEK